MSDPSFGMGMSGRGRAPALNGEAVPRLSPVRTPSGGTHMNGTRITGGARGGSLLVGAAMVALLATPATGQEVAPRPVLSGAVQVTANPTPVRAHSSPQIARNPTNGELVLVESDVRGARTCAIHISTDEGRSWSPGGDPMLKPFNDCGFYGEYGA